MHLAEVSLFTIALLFSQSLNFRVLKLAFRLVVIPLGGQQVFAELFVGSPQLFLFFPQFLVRLLFLILSQLSLFDVSVAYRVVTSQLGQHFGLDLLLSHKHRLRVLFLIEVSFQTTYTKRAQLIIGKLHLFKLAQVLAVNKQTLTLKFCDPFFRESQYYPS